MPAIFIIPCVNTMCRNECTTKSFGHPRDVSDLQILSGRPRQLRDLEELWTILKESVGASDIPAWLRSENKSFGGESPIDLLKEGKARDIIVEFRRLQAGEPVLAALRRPLMRRRNRWPGASWGSGMRSQ